MEVGKPSAWTRLLCKGEFISQREPCVVQKYAKHTAPVQNVLELDKVNNFLARLAMKGQP
jgi:hypothetical protein